MFHSDVLKPSTILQNVGFWKIRQDISFKTGTTAEKYWLSASACFSCQPGNNRLCMQSVVESYFFMSSPPSQLKCIQSFLRSCNGSVIYLLCLDHVFFFLLFSAWERSFLFWGVKSHSNIVTCIVTAFSTCAAMGLTSREHDSGISKVMVEGSLLICEGIKKKTLSRSVWKSTPIPCILDGVLHYWRVFWTCWSVCSYPAKSGGTIMTYWTLYVKEIFPSILNKMVV